MRGSTKAKELVLTLLLSTITLALLPLLLLIFCSLWLIRSLLSSCGLTKHEEFLGGLDAINSLHCNYSSTTLLSNISINIEVDGRLGVDEFRQMVESRWPQIVGEGKNRRRLTQYLTSLAGFSVFKDEADFKLRDHIRLLNCAELKERVTRQINYEPGSATGSAIQKFLRIQMDNQENSNFSSRHWTAEELSQLATDLARLPYEQQKSPWEILVLYNPENPKNSEESNNDSKNKDLENGGKKYSTVLFFRYAHGLGDGLALIAMQAQLLDQSQSEAYGKTLAKLTFSEQQQQKQKEQGPLASLLSFPQAVADIACDIPSFIAHQVQTWPHGRNPLSQDLTISTRCLSFQIPLEVLRALRRRHKGTATTPIIMTAFTRAVHEYKKWANNSNPSSLHVQPFVALPREINELGNTFTANGMRISTDPDLDPQQLVQEVNREYTDLYRASSPSTKLYARCVQFSGVMPKFMLYRSLNTAYTDANFTNMPAFEIPVSILGHPVTAHFGAAFVRMTCEFWIVSFGDHEKLNFTVQMDTEVVKSQDEARMLIKLFKQQLYEM